MKKAVGGGLGAGGSRKNLVHARACSALVSIPNSRETQKAVAFLVSVLAPASSLQPPASGARL